MNNILIRWMTRRDMPAVVSLETDCFEFPWQFEDFIRYLGQRNGVGMVAEIGNEVVGFMVYELHMNRIHVLNFAVAKDRRFEGIGTELMNKLKTRLSSEARNRIMIEVRESNLAAQLFFSKQGFRAVSILREFYDDSSEDAYLMAYRYQDAGLVSQFGMVGM